MNKGVWLLIDPIDPAEPNNWRMSAKHLPNGKYIGRNYEYLDPTEDNPRNMTKVSVGAANKIIKRMGFSDEPVDPITPAAAKE